MVYQYLMGPQGQQLAAAGARALPAIRNAATGLMRGPRFAGEGSTGTPTGDYGFSFAGRQPPPSMTPSPAAMPLRAAGGGGMSVMDSIMQSRNSGSSPYGTLGPFTPMAQGDVGVQGPQQSPYGSLGPFVPMPQGDVGQGRRSPEQQAADRPALFEELTRRAQPQQLMPQGNPYGTLQQQFSPMPEVQQSMMYDRQGLPDDALGGFSSARAPAPVQSMARQAAAIPMPPSRPRDLPGRTPGFLDQLLSGPDYQSNSMPVNVQAAGPAMQGQQMPDVAINYGDPESAADFFRADQLRMRNPQLPGFLGGF